MSEISEILKILHLSAGAVFFPTGIKNHCAEAMVETAYAYTTSVCRSWVQLIGSLILNSIKFRWIGGYLVLAIMQFIPTIYLLNITN